jgi:hypothetical protein
MSSLRQYLEWEASVRTSPPPGMAYASLAEFVLRHGAEYEYAPKPKSIRWGTVQQCFKNAWKLAYFYDELTYCEGYGLSLIPTPHAWCITADGKVVDNTWRPRDGTAQYFGVAFPIEVVNRAITLSGHYGVLQDWKHGYPILQQPYTPEAAIAKLKELRAA